MKSNAARESESWSVARVASRSEEAQGICSFVLEPEPGQSLPPFEAGAHIELHVGDVIRPYSLCNSPGDPNRYVLGVQREVGGKGGSVAICDSLLPGHAVQFRGPRNLFPLHKDTRSAVLLAGGIGITPLLAMAYQLQAQETPFTLHVCSQTEDRIPFRAQLAALSGAGDVQLHCSRAVPGGRPKLQDLIGSPRHGRHLYLCGPSAFLEGAVQAATELGWPQEAVHLERFAAEAVSAEDEQAFEVEIHSTGARIQVPPGVTVADALEQAGFPVVRSCNQGNCGTCITGVLSGTPDHRDVILTEEERARNDCFTPCCSRACTERLVLDL